MITINYEFFDELKFKLPSYRIKSLVERIGTHRRNSNHTAKRPPFLMVERMKLINDLNELKIEAPRLYEDNGTWVNYLVFLEPLAEHKKLDEARNLLKNGNFG